MPFQTSRVDSWPSQVDLSNALTLACATLWLTKASNKLFRTLLPSRPVPQRLRSLYTCFFPCWQSDRDGKPGADQPSHRRNTSLSPFRCETHAQRSETCVLPRVKQELVAAARYHVCQILRYVPDRHDLCEGSQVIVDRIQAGLSHIYSDTSTPKGQHVARGSSLLNDDWNF